MNVRKLIARGYQRRCDGTPPVNCIVRGDATEFTLVPLDLLYDKLGRPDEFEGIGILCPTYVGRTLLEEQLVVIGGLLAQIDQIHESFPDLPIWLFVGVQWSKGEESESIRRLEEIGRLVLPRTRVRYVGLSLPGPGKTRTLNAAIHLSSQLRLRGLGWIDDDIHLAPRCLEQMLRRFFAKNFRGAIGATKIPEQRTNFAAKLLFHLKSITTPACNYPHACCILVETDVIANGIPNRYISDDGFVCFELLRPELENPLEYLELVPTAHCFHYVGGPTGETLKRLRRMLLNHHIFMADYSAAKSRYYFRQILFYGLWPLAPWDGQRGFLLGLLKCFIKGIYFVWFLKIGVELLLRGLFRRPLQEINWSGYSQFEAMRPMFRDQTQTSPSA